MGVAVSSSDQIHYACGAPPVIICIISLAMHTCGKRNSRVNFITTFKYVTGKRRGYQISLEVGHEGKKAAWKREVWVREVGEAGIE